MMHVDAARFAGGGQAGALIRSHDWSNGPLGAPASWPRELHAVVSLMLAATSPIAVFWGQDFILLYNDAWRRLIGDTHTAGIGRPAKDAFPEEVWLGLQPVLSSVLSGEIGDKAERRQPAEPLWLTCNLNPIPLDGGVNGGVLSLAFGTATEAAFERKLRASVDRQAFLLQLGDALRQVSDPHAAIAVSAERLGRHLAADRVGYAEIEMSGEGFTVTTDWCAPGMASLAGRHRQDTFGPALAETLRAGQTVTLDDVFSGPPTDGREVAEAFRKLDTRAAIAVPLVKQGRLVAALYVHARSPRRWTGEEADLVRGIAERTWSAIENARAGKALRESETYVRLLLQSTAEAFYAVDQEGTTTHCNPAFLKMLGFAAEADALGRKLHDVIHHTHPDGSHYAVADCPIYTCARDGISAHVTDEVFYRLDGSAVPVEYWAYPILNDGKHQGAICTFIDITERRRAGDALKESEARFRLIADSAPVPMWVTQLDGKCSFVNQAYCDFLGMTFAQALDYSWTRCVHPEDAARIRAGRVASRGAAEPVTVEARYRNAAGEWRWLRSEIRPRRDSNGQHVGFIGASYDITIAKQAALDLQVRNDSLETRVEQSTQERDRVWALSRDVLVIIDSAGILRSVNPAWTTILGHEPAEVVGKTFLQFVSPQDHAATQQGLKRALQAQHLTNFVNSCIRKEGTHRFLSWHTSVAGDLVYGYGRDITVEKEQADALRQTEEALRHSQKMEALGQLTGGVAHDFNNLLQGISGALEILARRYVHTEEAHKLIRLAGGAVERGANLTKHLLSFARKQQLAARATDVNAAIARSSALLARSLGANVAIEHRLPQGVWLAMTDPNQLDVAILNLALNARDAMPGGGTITITTANIAWDGAREVAGWPADLAHGDYVRLSVIDAGEGMDEKVRARVFEPFFTTKTVGKGTGLGLSQVHGFAHQSGGTVSLSSQPGQGTKVDIFLPRASETAEAFDEVDATEWRGIETVLVVDDDKDVRELAATSLEEFGYRVLAADSGASGLDILGREPSIDLVLVDFVMPGMSGAEFVRLARRARPELKAIFMTGFADLEAVTEHALPDEIIHKPFKLATLAERISTALAAPGRTH